ncbi:hypothetical protein V9T40_014451 [Parthenolecanium corni]|uniref:FLYWCH-type domain-containing protein n=1 Tax=Parthenolecanium corni TaxID=536013 RepID=A0AAN9XYA3_9HEMI
MFMSDIEKWCCTKKMCLAFIKISPDGETVEENLQHNHPPDQTLVMNRQQVSNMVKRKAVDNPNERPRKLIREALQPHSLEVLTNTDLAYGPHILLNSRGRNSDISPFFNSHN